MDEDVLLLVRLELRKRSLPDSYLVPLLELVVGNMTHVSMHMAKDDLSQLDFDLSLAI